MRALSFSHNQWHGRAGHTSPLLFAHFESTVMATDCDHAQWPADATTLTATAMVQASFLIAPPTR